MKRVLLFSAIFAATVAAVATPALATPADHSSGPIRLELASWDQGTTQASVTWRRFHNAVYYMLDIRRVGGGEYDLGLGADQTTWDGNIATLFSDAGFARAPGDAYLIQVLGCRDDPNLADASQCWFSNTIEVTVGG